MRHFRPLLFTLLASFAGLAQATSCATPPMFPDRMFLDPHPVAEQAEIRRWMMEDFEQHIRADMAQYALIATGTMSAVSEPANIQFVPSRLATIKVDRYFRKPEDLAADDIYHVVVGASFSAPGASVLFMANPEPLERWQKRTAPPPKPRTDGLIELEEPTLDAPRSWAPRIWFGYSGCSNPIFPGVSEQDRAVMEIVERVSNDNLAPATVWLRPLLINHAQLKLSGELTLSLSRAGMADSAVEKQATLDAAGTEISLPPGEYRIDWPLLAGFRPPCEAGPERSTCELSLQGGTRAQAAAIYRPLSTVSILVVDARGEPMDYIGHLELLRTPVAGEPDFLPRTWPISPRFGVSAPVADFADQHGEPVMPGRYQLVTVDRQYSDSTAGRLSCELARSSQVPLRWCAQRGGAYSETGEIIPGHNIIIAELPDSLDLVQLDFVFPAPQRGEITVGPACSTVFNRNAGGSDMAQLRVLALRGQSYQLHQTCKDCKAYDVAGTTGIATESARIELKGAEDQSR